MIGFFIGLFLGGFVGVSIMALFQVNRGYKIKLEHKSEQDDTQ